MNCHEWLSEEATLNRRVTGASIRGRLVRINNGGNNGGRGLRLVVELFGSDPNGRKMIAWGGGNAEC